MLFEWDNAKYAANKIKHGIGFRDAAKVFLSAHTVIPSKQSGEPRFLATGVANGRFVTVVFTQRGDAIRIICSKECA